MRWVAALLLLAAPAAAQDFETASPPTAKDAIRLVLLNADIPLSVDPSCSGVNTTAYPDDPTIGDYVAGFLAEFATEADNRIDAGCKPPVGGRLSCSVTLRQRDDASETVWSWGLTFEADAPTGVIDVDTIVCTGAG